MKKPKRSSWMEDFMTDHIVKLRRCSKWVG